MLKSLAFAVSLLMAPALLIHALPAHALSVQATNPTPVSARVTGYQTVMIGDVKVTALYKGFVTEGAGREHIAAAFQRMAYAPKGETSSDIAAFIIDTGSKVTLVCVSGDDDPALRGYVMSSLVAAGYSPDDIDDVRLNDDAFRSL